MTTLAARISEVSETDYGDQIVRFFSFSDTSVVLALVASCLLGLSCGLLGSFVVVRRMALMGDTLAHAVLPGIALGFLWKLEKDPLSLRSTAVGILATVVVSWIQKTTRLKQDAALGMVLGVFFGSN